MPQWISEKQYVMLYNLIELINKIAFLFQARIGIRYSLLSRYIQLLSAKNTLRKMKNRIFEFIALWILFSDFNPKKYAFEMVYGILIDPYRPYDKSE